jgi:carbonic anhydrase/acetyltransferase-like protein (isoleucine patch superfamily)
MIIKHRGIEPQIDPSAYIAPNATIVGNVTIGPKTKIMFGAIINSEGSEISIGESTIISENAVVRATAEGNENHSVNIGRNVFIGPHTTILGTTLEPYSYIATGVTVLQGSKICSGSLIAVGALIHANTRIPKDSLIPPYIIAIGDPVQLFSPDQIEKVGEAIMSLGFANIAFNIDVTGKTRDEIYKETTLVRSKEYEAHFSDMVIEKSNRFSK